MLALSQMPTTIATFAKTNWANSLLGLSFTALLACNLQAQPTSKTQASNGSSDAHELQALVQKYCVGCHSQKLKTAGMILEGQPMDKVGQDAARWEKVLRKVRNNEMPPAAMPQPTPADRNRLTSYLTTELDRSAALHPNPGRPTVHRLNRTEYRNAIRDLFAVDVPADALPQDDTGYGFDNIADVLSMSPVLVERYMASAQRVARMAMGDTKIPPVVDNFDGLAEIRASHGIRGGRNEQSSEDLPFDSARGMVVRYSFPVDAEYVISVKLSGGGGEFGETAPPIGQVYDLRLPVKAGEHLVGLAFMRSDAIPEAGPGGRGGRQPVAGGVLTRTVDLRLDGALLKKYEIPDRVPQGKEINQLGIAGPYNVTGPGDTVSRRRILTCTPSSSADQAEPCAAKILRSVGMDVYRRPLNDRDLEPLMGFYRRGSKDGGFEAGIESALGAMLVSPNFLFRVEADPAGAAPGGIHKLGDYELASRLSFFLWSSIPDRELLTLAGQGKLKDTAVLTQQISRMLDDPKSDAFVDNFTGQWLMLRNLEQLKPDPAVFPAYDFSLRTAFREETKRFFNAVLRENLPVTDLIGAKFTFVNQRLAEFYGIPGIYGPRFRRIELPDGHRAGLLGQGSILTETSIPSRTSVVERGKWVLDSLLASPPPPPPPDVPPLELHEKERSLTMREAMEAHRANPVCAACHARMDPIGFALENFDGIGAWRDRDGGGVIDVSGKLPDGTPFSGPDGLRDLLLTRYRDQFISAFLEKLMTYALGRGTEYYDQPTMRTILRNAAGQNYSIPSLIRGIVTSDAFLTMRNRDS